MQHLGVFKSQHFQVQKSWTNSLTSQELNVEGSDIASRAGAAPVGLAVAPEGQVVWRIPAEPPIYQNIEATDPAAGLCHPRHPCKDLWRAFFEGGRLQTHSGTDETWQCQSLVSKLIGSETGAEQL